MEPYTATVWIVDRAGEEMVNIYEHRRNHYEVSHLPALSKEQGSQYCRNQKMQGQMKHPIFTLPPERLKLAQWLHANEVGYLRDVVNIPAM